MQRPCAARETERTRKMTVENIVTVIAIFPVALAAGAIRRVGAIAPWRLPGVSA
ncbi:MAG: hypothetical protein CM15mP21_1300 [Hyphomicrobiales bacterium]|nr:MAG: hypothetical protein CM15mP21_1300 [Hyphomicrobiales bacterium]